MRVLLVSPEFPLSFWSFPKSCKLTGSKTLIPPLGLITVAALLPTEWELRFVDLNVSGITEEDWRWADLIVISAMIAQMHGLVRVIQEAKRREKITVIGGPAATTLPDRIIDAGGDFVVRGEGENTVPDFLKAFAAGETKGVIENGEKPDMATSPVPRFDLLPLHEYDTLSIQTSRGCPFDCEFCDVVNLFGRKSRYKSPAQVIRELETLHELGARGHVFINDDNFIGNKAHARAVLRELTPWMKSRGEPFSFMTQVSVNLGQDLEMIDLMTDANFAEVFIGIESPDEDVLTLNRKYQNVRNPLIESLNNIKENGLTVVGSFIIGFDGEKKGAGERICSFVEETDIPIVMVNMLQAAPETRLWNRLKSEGRLLEERFIAENTLVGMFNFVPTRPEPEILDEYRHIWEYVYEPSRFLARAHRYFLGMRPTRRAMALSKGEAPPPVVPPSREPLRKVLLDLRALLSIMWSHGVRPSHRRQFWKGLFGLWKNNPSRLKKYLVNCAMAVDMFDVRDIIRNQKMEGETSKSETQVSKRRAPSAANDG